MNVHDTDSVRTVTDSQKYRATKNKSSFDY
uniref:Uncharacterized protein n=1 Tax=Anguilla anguilla TaxID=7936 RepID=A0A0E9T666_ANGAN